MIPKFRIAAVACWGFSALIAQETAQGEAPAVFTTAQAEAGRAAYQSTCHNCHTDALTGREGDPGEMPLVDTLPAKWQKLVKSFGTIPPLAGDQFTATWGARTTKDLSARISSAVGGFPPEDRDEQTYLNITAYVLQVNGARPGTQQLTTDTAVEIRSLMAPPVRQK